MTAPKLEQLFEPEGVVVVGASSHPAKFGFTALHNIIAGGYAGRVFAINREGGEILGVRALRDLDDLPQGAADLAFVCTPAGVNEEVLRACAKRGVRAAFVASGGYRESGPEGGRAEAELVALADELGITLAGPNGQGLVSTPVRLCAQIVGPMPPPGRISIVSQSGNLISSLMNYSCATGIGVARGISAGNASALSVADYLAWLGGDAATAVAVAYVEHAGRGRELFEAVRELASSKPVVIVKGGATAAGQAAAASHTGALASEDRVLDGALRQAGACRVATIEAAFDLAATFATQPLPRGPRTAVVTAAGGWGVLAADALARSTLSLVGLPPDLKDRIDGLLPPRWSGANPIDLAGGETRDTIPALLELVASHPGVDAVLYLGLGIQSNTARMLRAGPFGAEEGLARVVAFHERQDRRFATAAAEVSASTGKPILVASELAFADPANPGPATVRESGRLCYPSAERAVAALEASRWYAAFRERRSPAPHAG